MSGLKFSKGEYLFLASFARTVSEGIILGSSGAFFLPETFQLESPIPGSRYLLLMLVGLTFLAIGVILQKRSRE